MANLERRRDSQWYYIDGTVCEQIHQRHQTYFATWRSLNIIRDGLVVTGGLLSCCFFIFKS